MGIVIIANELGIPLTIDDLQNDIDLKNGIDNFSDISNVSKKFSINLLGVKGGIEPLKTSSPPLIVATSPEHFTVIREIQELGVKTIDNSGIETFQTWEEFEPTFRQAALIVKDFTPPDELPDAFLFYTKTADFGWVPAQPKIEYSFRGKNWSTKPVTIRQLSTSCGCTSVEIEPKTAQFGEEIVAKVRVEKGINTGKIMEKAVLEIAYEDAPPQVVELVIQAQAGHPFEFFPSSIQKTVLLGGTLENMVIQWSVISPLEEDMWEIVNVTANFNPAMVNPQVKDQYIQLQFISPQEQGIYKDTVRVQLQRKTGQTAQIEIPVEIEVHGDVIADVQTLSFGVVKKDQIKEKELELRSISQTPFTIVSYESTLPVNITLPKENTDSPRQKIVIAVDGSQLLPNQLHKGEVLFTLQSGTNRHQYRIEINLLRGNDAL